MKHTAWTSAAIERHAHGGRHREAYLGTSAGPGRTGCATEGQAFGLLPFQWIKTTRTECTATMNGFRWPVWSSA